jgi:hypothetical protein
VHGLIMLPNNTINTSITANTAIITPNIEFTMWFKKALSQIFT